MISSIKQVRNFCIIAHIDHGKSTLADRMLSMTHTVSDRDMRHQMLDQMDLERERGITIKLAPVRMEYQSCILNLIDTPGHVDFSYEVSRSLAAVEGAVLLVDSTQGIEAQTLSTLYTAMENDLTIIPVVNKIDLPAARRQETAAEIIKLLGCKPEDILYASGKTGEGVEALLERIIKRVPAPEGNNDDTTTALIFDSVYDNYRGVIAYIRMVNGAISAGNDVSFIQSGSQTKVEETGTFSPKLIANDGLQAGEIGYLVTGFKTVDDAQVGDTVTLSRSPSKTPLPGYKKVKPFVYASIFCTDSDEYPNLKDAIAKLKLNDAAITFEPENSPMLGHGFRCGFLGLLHMDIVRERLEREFNLDLVITSPSVVYQVLTIADELLIVEKSEDMPTPSQIKEIREPWATLEVIAPKSYIGAVMELTQTKRANYHNTEFLDEDRVVLYFEIPLAELIVDFYDQLKSLTKGYASMNYDMKDYRAAKLEKIDIVINDQKIEALSFVIFAEKAYREARRLVERLKELIPRQNFEIKIQASIGAKIIASERISPFRKDVIAKLYGGDVTRKNKLLDKQKKGKKKMRSIGKVEVPSDVFIKVLRND